MLPRSSRIRKRFRAQGQALATTIAVSLCIGIPSVQAFQLSTPYTQPCHERITAAAIQNVPVHSGTQSLDVTSLAVMSEMEKLELGLNGDEDAAALLALLIGVRDPDTSGQPPLNLTNLHLVHALGSQAAHALREKGDEGESGKALALERIVNTLEEFTRQSREAQAREPSGLRSVTVSLDFVGHLTIEVDESFYLAGTALHMIQDSFSHTIRDREGAIVDIANYVDAQKLDNAAYDEAVLGVRHSRNADRCEDAPLAVLAEEASMDYLYLINLSDLEYPGAFSIFIEKYFRLSGETACSSLNRFCESPYASEFTDPTMPYWGCSTLDTGPVPDIAHASHGTVASALMLGLFLLIRRRSARAGAVSLGLLLSVGSADAEEARVTSGVALEFESRLGLLDSGLPSVSVDNRLRASVKFRPHLKISAVVGQSAWARSVLRPGWGGDLMAGLGLHLVYFSEMAESIVTIGPTVLLFDAPLHPKGSRGAFVSVEPIRLCIISSRKLRLSVTPLEVSIHAFLPEEVGFYRFAISGGISLQFH